MTSAGIVTGHGKRLDFQRRPADRALRRDVFIRDGFTCQHCGSAPAANPENYDGRYSVAVEGGRFRHLQLDHIHPFVLGGAHTLDNLQTLCDACNLSKGHRL